MTRYAINVCDMTYSDLDVPVVFMVGPVVKTQELVLVNPGTVDSRAVVLECPEPQALAICEFMQKAGRDRKRLVRCYQEGPRGGWKELPRNKKEKS